LPNPCLSGEFVFDNGVANMTFEAGTAKNRAYHRTTTWGNVFRTVVLRGAGNEAKFGEAGGDSVMYIPCNHHEQLNLVLPCRQEAVCFLNLFLMSESFWHVLSLQAERHLKRLLTHKPVILDDGI